VIYLGRDHFRSFGILATRSERIIKVPAMPTCPGRKIGGGLLAISNPAVPGRRIRPICRVGSWRKRACSSHLPWCPISATRRNPKTKPIPRFGQELRSIGLPAGLC